MPKKKRKKEMNKNIPRLRNTKKHNNATNLKWKDYEIRWNKQIHWKL